MFVVCGEALFDVFIADGVAWDARTVPFSARVGGSPFNVAIGLARLGCDSALLTGLSTDFLGQRLLAVLVAERVSTHLIARKQAPTTLGFVQHGEDGVPAYAFYGTGAADRSLSVDDLPARLDGAECLHVGSYSIVMPPTSDAVLQLFQRESGQRIISIDPNIRPTVEPDMAIWCERLGRLLMLADVVKVSDEDLSWLYPGQAPDAIIRQWMGFGLRLMVVTRGSKGALLTSRVAQVEVEAPQIRVVDTVGAGDTFQAALLDAVVTLKQAHGEDWASLLDAATLTRIGHFAAVAAAITCSRKGADLPTRAEVNQAL
ncbi:MAG: carbohydrate kinase [Thiothrix sp.]|nr:carbohydrate kinase [Thiothrix sp.]HPQ94244.1 carbohydrate kinase [Thiolinea sp.]